MFRIRNLGEEKFSHSSAIYLEIFCIIQKESPGQRRVALLVKDISPVAFRKTLLRVYETSIRQASTVHPSILPRVHAKVDHHQDCLIRFAKGRFLEMSQSKQSSSKD